MGSFRVSPEITLCDKVFCQTSGSALTDLFPVEKQAGMLRESKKSGAWQMVLSKDKGDKISQRTTMHTTVEEKT
jgi:hypothetical protein